MANLVSDWMAVGWVVARQASAELIKYCFSFQTKIIHKSVLGDRNSWFVVLLVHFAHYLNKYQQRIIGKMLNPTAIA